MTENDQRCNGNFAKLALFIIKVLKAIFENCDWSSNYTKLRRFNPPPQKPMKNHPVHENLDTSFVNLSALVKYLRRRQFIGSVRIELSGYDADIDLTAEHQIKAREHDRIAGRISEGEEALQRILIRAREPGGIINVYQTDKQTGDTDFEKNAQPVLTKKEIVPPPPVQTPTAPGEMLPNNAKSKNLPGGNSTASENMLRSGLKLPKFPFDLSNKVEAKAKQNDISTFDWQRLIDLVSELVGAIDKSVSAANLDFTAAFEKARLEISEDYPFMHPVSGTFSYKGGEVSMDEQISATLFVASINEALRRILDKLGNNPKFADVYRTATQSIIVLIRQRKPLYDKFLITPTLEKVVGT